MLIAVLQVMLSFMPLAWNDEIPDRPLGRLATPEKSTPCQPCTFACQCSCTVDGASRLLQRLEFPYFQDANSSLMLLQMETSDEIMLAPVAKQHKRDPAHCTALLLHLHCHLWAGHLASDWQHCCGSQRQVSHPSSLQRPFSFAQIHALNVASRKWFQQACCVPEHAAKTFKHVHAS